MSGEWNDLGSLYLDVLGEVFVIVRLWCHDCGTCLVILEQVLIISIWDIILVFLKVTHISQGIEVPFLSLGLCHILVSFSLSSHSVSLWRIRWIIYLIDVVLHEVSAFPWIGDNWPISLQEMISWINLG